MTPTGARADRFVRELADLEIPDPAAGRPKTWLRLGTVLMLLGAALAVSAYFLSHTTRDPLVQRDAITLGLAAVTAAVVGSAIFLRYSLTGFLRFWMARQSHDIALLADRLLDPDTGRDLTGPDPDPDPDPVTLPAPQTAPRPTTAARDTVTTPHH
ncbi:hypothetical protein MXD62_30105 [Frankia sp. Mgl5]|uniref:hypothetical protein n=1 Tax=Frankia sp. Mgl5 TaxID=2933793 RepID=UPI00200C61AF|nr:hypothetical protein [Frankia sp. Mgl5]MCK9931341.1 hypothetical protein [Frankia sp. Mgl5]